VTVLKPLCGDEPLLEEALASNLQQDYPHCQLVFGVQSATDPALAVVERLRRRFPERDIAVVVDATPHGSNRKIANLINMYAAAKHDVLVVADSDVHVAPDYLARIAAALEEPGTGLVTTLYAGLATTGSLPGLLGATAITHSFLPGALLGRAMGRQDCLGATMALRRETLDAIGGLHALADHLADDNVLGRKVRELGLSVRMATTVPATTVPETTMVALFRHELRWARTIRALVPTGFALSSVQHPLAWATLAVVLSGGAGWAVGLFLAGWGIRAAVALGIDAELGLAKSALATPAPIWLLPLRDLMSASVILASIASDRVEWRGHMMHAGHADRAPNPAKPATSAATT
jgi:ceramide glucosyltransferase